MIDDFIEFVFCIGFKDAEEVIEFSFFLSDDVFHELMKIFDEKGVFFMIIDGFFVDICDFFLLLEDKVGQSFVFIIPLNLFVYFFLEFVFDVFQHNSVEMFSRWGFELFEHLRAVSF